jgi:hypothetical protein
MMGKGGKYDAEAEALLKKLGAHALVLLVTAGARGAGVSVSQNITSEWSVLAAAEYLRELPRVLRSLADSIERDLSGPQP